MMFGVGVLEICLPDSLVDTITDDSSKKESITSVLNTSMVLHCIKNVSKKLYVCYSGIKSVQHEKFVREKLAFWYNELWDVALDCNNADLDCIFLVKPNSVNDLIRDEQVEVIFNAGPKIDKDCFVVQDKQVLIQHLDNILQEEVFGVNYILYDNVKEELPSFEKVAVGGTFDHFHNGHKKLLTICSQICKTELTIGVTDDSMLGQKKMKELIEDVEVRQGHVRTFLKPVAPDSLKLNIVLIKDIWGPTIVDPTIEALVCSTETLKGARLINEKRVEKGFKPLQIIAVARSNAYTLSSTFIRNAKASI